ncbi:MAG: hypothetical protein ACRD3W_02320, partial [Terriglobales bacterium]
MKGGIGKQNCNPLIAITGHRLNDYASGLTLSLSIYAQRITRIIEDVNGGQVERKKLPCAHFRTGIGADTGYHI